MWDDGEVCACAERPGGGQLAPPSHSKCERIVPAFCGCVDRDDMVRVAGLSLGSTELALDSCSTSCTTCTTRLLTHSSSLGRIYTLFASARFFDYISLPCDSPSFPFWAPCLQQHRREQAHRNKQETGFQGLLTSQGQTEPCIRACPPDFVHSLKFRRHKDRVRVRLVDGGTAEKLEKWSNGANSTRLGKRVAPHWTISWLRVGAVSVVGVTIQDIEDVDRPGEFGWWPRRTMNDGGHGETGVGWLPAGNSNRLFGPE